MTSLSSNYFSTDTQLADAMEWLANTHTEVFNELLAKFPEWRTVKWQDHGSWIDTDAMGVDQEWSNWLIDAVEGTGLVMWEDGEPWTVEGDEHEPK